MPPLSLILSVGEDVYKYLIPASFALLITASDEYPLGIEAYSILCPKIFSSLLIEFNGEKLPLTLLKKHMASEDREVRKNAFTAFGNELEKHADFIDNNFEIEKIEMIETTQSQVVTYKLKSIIEERITCVFNRNGILSMIEF